MANSNQPHDDRFRFEIEASSKQATHATIELYGVIGGYYVTVNQFLDRLKQYKKLEELTVKISSVGGSFSHGLPIFNELDMHPAHITTVNMGYAMSMGSYLMLVGDKRKSAANGIQMLHKPLALICDYLNAAQLEKDINTLNVHEAVMIGRYKKALNKSTEDVKRILKDETYYTAEQALAAGLIHEIIGEKDISASAKDIPEAAWQDFAKMIQKPPPHNVIEQLSSTEPVAYAAISTHIKALKNEQHEQNNMPLTTEQMTELKNSITDIVTPVNAGLSDLSKNFEAQVTAQKQQEAKAEDDRKTLLEKVTGLEQKVSAIKSENESLKSELTTLRNTAANNPSVPTEPDGELPLLDGFAEYQKATSYAHQ